MKNLHKFISKIFNFLKQPDGNEEIGKRLLHGISWGSLGLIITRCITFAIALIQAHLLGKQGYGELAIVLNTLVLFGILSSGYGATCSKYIAEFKSENPIRAGRIFALSITLVFALSLTTAIILASSSEVIAKYALNSAKLAPLIPPASIIILLQSMCGVFDGVLLGLQAFKKRNIPVLAQVLVWLPATILFTESSGVIGSLMAYALSYIICVVFYIWTIWLECKRQNFAPNTSNMWSEYKILVQHTLPLIVNTGLFVPTTWICNAILVQQPKGLIALGGYNAASQWRIVILQIPWLFLTTVNPIMSQLIGKKKKDEYIKMFTSSYNIVLSISIITSVGVILFSKELMILFGKEFSADFIVLNIISLTAGLVVITNVLETSLMLINKGWSAFWINIIFTITTISLSLILIPYFNAIGLSVAFFIGYLVQSLITLTILRRHLEINYKYMMSLIFTIVLIGITTIYVSSNTGEPYVLPIKLAILFFSLYFSYTLMNSSIRHLKSLK